MQKDKQAMRMCANIFMKTQHYQAARKIFAELGDLNECAHVDALVIQDRKRETLVSATKEKMPILKEAADVSPVLFRCHIDFLKMTTDYITNLN